MRQRRNNLREKKRINRADQGNIEQNLETQDNPITTLVNPRSNQRLILVWAVMILGALGLGYNLFRLQILEAEKLQKKALSQQTLKLTPFIPRRPITDRNGNFLATDRPVYTLYAHPKLFKISRQKIASQLSPILVQSETTIIKKFNQGKSGLIIAKNITEQQAQIIRKKTIEGLELNESYSRFYPQQELTADIIGYVDTEHRGQAGLEYSQQHLLERNTRSLRASQLGNGMLAPDLIPEGFLQVDDLQLQLTIDSRLQRAARSALQIQMKKFRAKRGAIIVMDVHDGSILSLVSEPTYNPNKYSKYPLSLFKNWAIADLYEPGSTFKPVNIAIALENKAIDPNSTFYDNGKINIGIWEIKNAEGGGHGRITVSEVLQYSSNIGMVQIMQRLKPDLYYSWLEKIGLGQTVGIDLPFEAVGAIKNKKQFIYSPIEPATTSFGQGISITPIHLVQLQATIANGGKLVTPHLVKGLYNSQGQMYWQPTLPTKRQIFSSKTSETVLKMMELVVTQGTGKSAEIPGYRIGGKTGTAQKAIRGGYHASAKITSFVGIIPINAPKYVVLAVVDEPKETDGIKVFGSTVAAPIVKDVMESLINIEKIPPSPGLESQLKEQEQKLELEQQKEQKLPKESKPKTQD